MKKKIFLYTFFIILVFSTFYISDIFSKNLSEEEQLILVGTGAFSDGFYDIAEKQFSLFIKDYSQHGKVYNICYLLGKTLLIKGKLKEAKAIFTKIVNENKYFENIDYTLFWLSDIEMKLGNGEEDKKILLSIIKNFPKFEWLDYSYYILGLLEFGSNKPSHAESFFKKASQLSKNNELIRSSFFWLGILSYKQHYYEVAVNYFQPILKEPKFVPQIYLKYALFWLGESQLKLGRYSEAKINFEAYYERFKNDPLIPEIYWKVGFCEYRLGNIKDSIEIFRSFKNNFKDSPLLLYTHYLLGEMFLISGDYSSSVKELNFILNKPQEHILWGISFLSIFWNYIYQNDIQGANRIFQRLQKLNHFDDEKMFIQWLNAEMIFYEGRISDSLPYYFNILNTGFREKALFQIGRSYFFENKFRDAITNLDILFLEFPNSKYFEEGLFIKGECLIKLGNLDHALDTYEVIIKQNKKEIWQLFAFTQMGCVYSLRNENEKAENTFKKIIDYFPHHPLVFHAAFQLGNLYFRKNYIAEAIHYYSTVLKGNKFDLFGEVYFSLGEIFYQQGKYEKAYANFETAIRYLKESSLWFFLTQLEIGNLQRKWGKYEEAKKSYMIILNNSRDEEIKKAAKELITHIESY